MIWTIIHIVLIDILRKWQPGQQGQNLHVFNIIRTFLPYTILLLLFLLSLLFLEWHLVTLNSYKAWISPSFPRRFRCTKMLQFIYLFGLGVFFVCLFYFFQMSILVNKMEKSNTDFNGRCYQRRIFMPCKSV